jgi:hypothetical protein
MPGTTNASVVGFMTSMVTATAMTARSARWARWIGASSNAATRTPATRSGWAPAPRGTTPYADNAMPTTIRAMPTFIEGSIGIPASW